MNELISQAKTAASEGVRPPRFAYEIVTDEAKAIIAGKPFDESETDSSLWADVNSKVAALVEKETITQKRADELTAQAKAALLESIAPAYESLVSFLKDDIEKSDAVAQGVHALPQGGDFYAYRLKTITTTDMTADEIHELGLKEVERIRAQMEAIKEQDGFEGTLQEYFAHIRDSKDNSRYYFDNTDEGLSLIHI